MRLPSFLRAFRCPVCYRQGTERMDAGITLLIRIRDGNQKELVSDFYKNPSILFEGLPFYNNFGDNYAVLASVDGYDQAGFYPVHVSPPSSNPSISCSCPSGADTTSNPSSGTHFPDQIPGCMRMDDRLLTSSI